MPKPSKRKPAPVPVKPAKTRINKDMKHILLNHMEAEFDARIDDTALAATYGESFLGDRFCIQINRDKTNLFTWSVLVGQQFLTVPGASCDYGRGVGERLCDAIFDACVQAALADKRQFSVEEPVKSNTEG